MKKKNIIPMKHRCSRCGALRTGEELNGYDPTTKDYSRSYCRDLANCKSESAEKTFKKIVDALDPEEE